MNEQTIPLSGQLRQQKDELVAMGAMVQKALSSSVEALKNRNLALARKVMADDARINEKRFAIEDKLIELVAPQKIATDEMRVIVSILNIITELERIGDYAEGIAKIVILIGDEPPLKPLIDIPRMCDITVDMVRLSLESFLNSNVDMAKKVISMDTSVDNLYDQVFRELLTFMMSDPRTISRATRLIWVAHNLERAADRSTNISERVIYTVTGKMVDTEGSRY